MPKFHHVSEYQFNNSNVLTRVGEIAFEQHNVVSVGERGPDRTLVTLSNGYEFTTDVPFKRAVHELLGVPDKEKSGFHFA